MSFDATCGQESPQSLSAVSGILVNLVFLVSVFLKSHRACNFVTPLVSIDIVQVQLFVLCLWCILGLFHKL